MNLPCAAGGETVTSVPVASKSRPSIPMPSAASMMVTTTVNGIAVTSDESKSIKPNISAKGMGGDSSMNTAVAVFVT